jgi:hypothetical protein
MAICLASQLMGDAIARDLMMIIQRSICQGFCSVMLFWAVASMSGVVISAFCTVGPAVTLGIGCKLHAGSHVCGNTIIGDYCEVLK